MLREVVKNLMTEELVEVMSVKYCLISRPLMESEECSKLMVSKNSSYTTSLL